MQPLSETKVYVEGDKIPEKYGYVNFIPTKAGSIEHEGKTYYVVGSGISECSTMHRLWLGLTSLIRNVFTLGSSVDAKKDWNSFWNNKEVVLLCSEDKNFLSKYKLYSAKEHAEWDSDYPEIVNNDYFAQKLFSNKENRLASAEKEIAEDVDMMLVGEDLVNDYINKMRELEQQQNVIDDTVRPPGVNGLMFKLARLFEKGENGVKKSDEKAIEWYSKIDDSDPVMHRAAENRIRQLQRKNIK